MDTRALKGAFFLFLLLTEKIYCGSLPHDPALRKYLERYDVGSSTPLVGGANYDTLFKLENPQGSYVLRVLNPRRSLEKRKLICEATEAIGKKGLGPKVIWYDDSFRFLITEFIKGDPLTPSDMQDPVLFKKFVFLLRECHRTLASFTSSLAVYSLKQRVLQRIEEIKSSVKNPHFLPLKTFLENIDFLELPQLVHGDIKGANILRSGNQLFFIDWGEVGPGSLYDDLGSLSFHFNLTPPQQKYLLELYFGKEPLASMVTLLKVHHWLSQAHFVFLGIRKRGGRLEKADHGFLSGWKKDVKYLDILRRPL